MDRKFSGKRTLNGRTQRMVAIGEQQSQPGYRITSSARSKIDSGNVIPSTAGVGHDRPVGARDKVALKETCILR
jgi:hypothetical protein